MTLDSYFVVTTPGLETITAGEMQALGIEPAEVESGGILFKGDVPALYSANLHLRTANRVLARLGNFFRATTFPGLKERLVALPWERFLAPGKPVSLRVTCHHSRLYHSDAVARTLLSALEKRLGAPSPLVKASEEGDQSAQLVIVRLQDDICTVSMDSSGIPLHKRGYRQAVAKAPLRETLAAAMLIASGWDRQSPLLDPFCGSGTIPIESAQMACRVPPGISRVFRFSDWPVFDKEKWNGVLAGAKNGIADTKPSIFGYDRDAGAIEFSQANAARAGQKNNIKFLQQAVSYLESPSTIGTIVTNPPYGVRTKESNDLRDLFARFGAILLEKFKGWTVVMLSPDDVLTGNLGLSQPDETLRFLNGGLPVKILKYKL